MRRFPRRVSTAAGLLRAALLLIPLVLVARPAPSQEPASPTSPPSPAAQTITVGPPVALRVWNREIIQLRASGIGTTAEERVGRARQRLLELSASDYDDSVRAEPGTVGGIEGTFVQVGRQFILAIVPQDLDPDTGGTTIEAGNLAARRIGEVLRARKDQGRLAVILRGVGLSLIATILLVLALRVIGRVRRRVLERPITTRLSGRARVMGVDLGQMLTAVERGLSKFTALSAGIVVLYVWLTFVLGQFPYSHPWSRELGGYLQSLLLKFGAGILGAIPGLFAVVLIFLLTRIAVRAIVGFFQGVESGQIELDWLEPETAKATRRVVVVLVWSFAIVVAYPYIPGSESPVFKGVSVMLGLMVTLGSAGAVNHLLSGLVIVYSRSCKPGDYVRVGDLEGTVTVIGVLSTKILTLKREMVTLPNSVLVGGAITNYTTLARDSGAMITTTLAVGYDTPWRKVEGLILGAARDTEGVRATPEPFVLQRSLSNFYVEYELRAYVDRPEIRLLTLSRLHGTILDAFNAARVQIMTPAWEGQPEYKLIAPSPDGHDDSPEKS